MYSRLHSCEGHPSLPTLGEIVILKHSARIVHWFQCIGVTISPVLAMLGGPHRSVAVCMCQNLYIITFVI